MTSNKEIIKKKLLILSVDSGGCFLCDLYLNDFEEKDKLLNHLEIEHTGVIALASNLMQKAHEGGFKEGKEATYQDLVKRTEQTLRPKIQKSREDGYSQGAGDMFEQFRIIIEKFKGNSVEMLWKEFCRVEKNLIKSAGNVTNHSLGKAGQKVKLKPLVNKKDVHHAEPPAPAPRHTFCKCGATGGISHLTSAHQNEHKKKRVKNDE